MKSKKIVNAASALVLSASILATNTINADANITVDDAIEMAYDDLETNTKVKNGTTIIEQEDEPKVVKEVIRELDDLELGDIVNLCGSGYSSSDGSGKKTYKYNNCLMAIVRVKKDAEYPYALVRVYNDGSISGIIGWFKGEDIKARYVHKTITEYADIQTTIIDTKDIPPYEPNTWDFLNEYYDYIDGKSIQVKYVWPEVEREYDVSYTVRFQDNVQTREFFDGDDIFYYDYDWQNGTITHEEATRDKIDAGLILQLSDKKGL